MRDFFAALLPAPQRAAQPQADPCACPQTVVHGTKAPGPKQPGAVTPNWWRFY